MVVFTDIALLDTSATLPQCQVLNVADNDLHQIVGFASQSLLSLTLSNNDLYGISGLNGCVNLQVRMRGNFLLLLCLPCLLH